MTDTPAVPAHTPTPWVLRCTDKLFDGRLTSGGNPVRSLSRNAIEELLQGAYDAGRAVNAHDALVAENAKLRAVLAILVRGTPITEEQRQHVEAGRDEGRRLLAAALAAAGEGR